MSTNRLQILLASLLFCGTVCGMQDAMGQAPKQRPPNLLIILTDDQGWPTLSCYGNQHVATPQLDRLAAAGVRFTDAYVMPQCTPTRAALLTGQHTARNRMWHVIPWYGSPWAMVAEPPFREQFVRSWSTLPQQLRECGYQTGMAGKWHLTTGADGDYVSLNPDAASAYGFDFVAPRGVGSQNSGDKWVDHLTAETIHFIEQHRDQPWFFYLSHHTLHGEVSAPDPLVETYRARGAPSSGMFNATYLAAIEHLDHSIGQLMEALDRLEVAEQTLVVFLSDNGGLDTSYLPPNLADAPCDGSAPLRVAKQEFDNAPLREGKGSPYEGGIRVPCIVRWPERIAAGQTIATPVHVTDWMPTLLAAAGATPADEWPQDGQNLLPLMTGQTLPPRPLFFYMPLYDLRWGATPCAVIRDGDWKLVESFGDWFDNDLQWHAGSRLELFNLRTDLGETENLAMAEPDRAAALRSKLHCWIQAMGAPIPATNPHLQRHRMLEETKQKQTWNP